MEFTNQTFANEIENYQGVSVVDFFAPWCGPCKVMGPMIDTLMQEYKDKNVKIGKVNIDENQETAEKYNIMSVPTIIIYKDGKVIDQINGLCSIEEIKEKIEKARS